MEVHHDVTKPFKEKLYHYLVIKRYPIELALKKTFQYLYENYSIY